MPRAVRTGLLIVGAAVLVILIVHIGPAVIVGLLRQVGWSLVVVSGVYAVHLAVRAVGIWRSLPDATLGLVDVLRIRFAAESVEMLTFTGPFLAEPAKGWLLARRGVKTADAYGAIAIEYLLYTAMSAWIAASALSLLIGRRALPVAVRVPVLGVIALLVLFTGAFVYAAVTETGLIVPALRAAGALIGRKRALAAARQVEPVERVLVHFMHARPRRLLEVLGLEFCSHALLVLEIGILFRAIGVRSLPLDPWIIEGGVKFTSVAFFFIPGQVGASESVYALVTAALGLPAAVGLTLALVRRLRALIVAGFGLLVLPPDLRPAVSRLS
ncbi:MAG TPA: lysylphosphatidylglycerol synthase domain-containing protein [Vicinamibacterales bacterium]|nr:lysylphosphatidylglycerol synthase domain-containing protein [Vicinamibacterales bacterium]